MSQYLSLNLTRSAVYGSQQNRHHFFGTTLSSITGSFCHILHFLNIIQITNSQ